MEAIIVIVAIAGIILFLKGKVAGNIKDKPQYALFLKAIETLRSNGFEVEYRGGEAAWIKLSSDGGADDAILWVMNSRDADVRVSRKVCTNKLAKFVREFADLRYILQQQHPSLYEKYKDFDAEEMGFYWSHKYICAYFNAIMLPEDMDEMLSNWLKAREIISQIAD